MMKHGVLSVCAKLLGLTGCGDEPGPSQPPAEDDPQTMERKRMVESQLEGFGRGIRNPRVLAAMERVPRHEFVPAAIRSAAYEDRALPIGFEQTISQPFVVALMTEALDPQPGDRVLEIGTGSGYQAAVLSDLVNEVFTIEIIDELAARAKTDLQRLGFHNVRVRSGDGFQGWPEKAPFDAIIVTCGPEEVPEPLIDQLADGGRMIIPIGPAGDQQLVLLRKRGGKLHRETLLSVRFVPMTGAAEKPRERP